MQNIFYVAAGGALGAVVRYGLQSGMLSVYTYFPWGTFLANFIGCFLAGFTMRYVPDLGPGSRLFFATGFLGALTTMSGFSQEFMTMLDEKRFAPAALYWTLSAIVCVAASGLGLWLVLRYQLAQAD